MIFLVDVLSLNSLVIACRYVNMGMKRHPEHHVEFYEWAPGTVHFIIPMLNSRNHPQIFSYL